MTSLIIDIVFSNIVRPKGFMSAWNDLYRNNINADYLIFGTSRAQGDIVSNIIKDSLNITVFNLGEQTGMAEVQLIRLKEHLKHCTKKPKHILLEIYPYSVLDFSNQSCFQQIYPYMLYNSNFYKYTQIWSTYNKTDFFIPLKRYGSNIGWMIENSILKSSEDTCYRGYYNNWGDWDAEIYNLSKQKCKKFEMNSQRIYYIKEFIKTCIINDLSINIFYAPENKLHKNCYTNKQEFLKLFQTIADSFKIEFKDFSTDSIPINTDTLYYHDIYHLNSQGANKFTSEFFVPYMRELFNL